MECGHKRAGIVGSGLFGDPEHTARWWCPHCGALGVSRTHYDQPTNARWHKPGEPTDDDDEPDNLITLPRR